MTIASEDARTGPYTGNGATTVFAYDFKVSDEAHLVVTTKVVSTGVETVQTLTTHYSVSGVGSEGGGNVTMVTFPASTETLTISRTVPRTQGTDLQNRGATQPATLEAAYDKSVQISQDLAEVQARTMKFAVSSDLTSFDTSIPSPVALKAIAINAAGTAFELVDEPSIAAAAAAASAAAALVSENNSASSESAAGVSETNAGNSETAAAASFDSFDDRYLGAKASEPTLDNDGDALLDGAMYFNTTTPDMFVYDLTNTIWVTVSNSTSAAAAAADVVLTNADVVSSNANVVSTNADVVLTNADVVLTNADVALTQAATSAIALGYTFSTTTSMADPGSGLLRFNNATLASVTAIAIDDVNADSADVSDFITTWDDPVATNKGFLQIVEEGTLANFAIFLITGLTDNAGWTELAVTYLDSNVGFADTDSIRLMYSRAGATGPTGATGLTGATGPTGPVGVGLALALGG
tara:strand:+ start:4364 stop:5767 length:1404 start_codon:yes stop_codon:yes gene_type:complete